jgi:hypothetical protein
MSFATRFFDRLCSGLAKPLFRTAIFLPLYFFAILLVVRLRRKGRAGSFAYFVVPHFSNVRTCHTNIALARLRSFGSGGKTR